MNKKPNILFIHSDQHRYDCLGLTGHPQLKTPTLDRLAADGITFTNAFTPTPLCVPARNCLLHGQWSSQHLCIANYDTEAPRPPSKTLPHFPEQLKKNGYTLGYTGKWHVSETRNALDYGFDDFIDEEKYPAWRKETGLPPVPQTNKWFGELDPHITPEQSRLAWGADHTIRLMEKAAASDQPFFIRWDPSEPHLPNIVPEPYFSMYPPETIEPWPSYPDPLDGKPYIQAQQLRTWKLGDWDWNKWAKLVSRYLGEISLLDNQIGRVLAKLDELNLSDNTLVIYTTDHGDMCGGHGMIDKHFIMYDDVVHVPLLMRWPNRIRPGSVCADFVSSEVDLGPTFCAATGSETPETFSGQNLLDLIDGKTAGRKDILSAYHGNQFGLYSQRMVRNNEWKYVWNATAEDELYDLVNDPAELCNRATDPDCLPQLSGLRRRLLEWMEETGDMLLNDWNRAQLEENLTL